MSLARCRSERCNLSGIVCRLNHVDERSGVADERRQQAKRGLGELLAVKKRLARFSLNIIQTIFTISKGGFRFLLYYFFVIYSLKKNKKTLISFIYHHFICFMSGTRPGALKPSVGDGKKSSWYHLYLFIMNIYMFFWQQQIVQLHCKLIATTYY